MISIGQFSKTCLVTIKTLHYYDKIGLLHPAKIDPDTGYRYYEESQLSTMLLIAKLKRYGFSLQEIQQILCESNQKALYSKLYQQKQILEQQMVHTKTVIQELEQHLSDFERTGEIMSYQGNYDVQLEQTNDRMILSSRQNMSIDEFGIYFGKLYETIFRKQIPADGKGMAIYHDKEFDPTCNDIEIALEVYDPSAATRVLEGGLCATTIHYGAYSNLPEAYGKMMQWIKENGYELISSPYEIYVKTQYDCHTVEDWETKIYFPIHKK